MNIKITNKNITMAINKQKSFERRFVWIEAIRPESKKQETFQRYIEFFIDNSVNTDEKLLAYRIYGYKTILGKGLQLIQSDFVSIDFFDEKNGVDYIEYLAALSLGINIELIVSSQEFSQGMFEFLIKQHG